MIPRCIGCHRTPDELSEYRDAADEFGLTPNEYVEIEEGTYNPDNGHFACTDCYIGMGMPTSSRGWTAP